MAVYKLNEITKTLDKLFKYNVKTTEKVANLKWQEEKMKKFKNLINF